MRRGYGFLFVVLILLIESGCWNRRELNNVALVVAMAIDRSGERYSLTVQVVDPGEVAAKGGTSGRTPVTTYTETAESIFEASRRMTRITPRKLYFSHLQMLVISEEIAREGISKPLEFMSRNHEFRQDFYVVVTRRIPAKNILNNLTTLEKIPANKMRSSLKTSQQSWAPTAAVTLDELISGLTSEGKDPVLTGITIVGDIRKGGEMANVERIRSFARLEYKGIAVFDKDKLVGWLNEKESKGYNYITNKVKSSAGKIPCPDGGDMVVEIMNPKTTVTGKVESGSPTFHVRLVAEANIEEVACPIDLTQTESIRKLNETASNTGIDVLEAAIQKAKKLKSDIFGFGEVLHRSDPQAWKTLKKDWGEHFSNATVTVEAVTKIRRTGTVNRSFIDEIK